MQQVKDKQAVEVESLGYLKNAGVKYSFLCFERDPDLEAIRVYHIRNPEMIFAISFWSGEMVDDENLTTFDEEIPRIPCHCVEYWDQTNPDNDKVLHKCKTTYEAVQGAVYEVLMQDFNTTDFREPQW